MHSQREHELEEKLLRQHFQVRLAHEAMMLDDAQAVLADQRLKVRGHNTAENVNMAKSQPKADDGMIHIGDIIHQPPLPKSGGSLLTKLALGTALAALPFGAGAATVGLGLPWLLDRIKPVEKIIEKTTERPGRDADISLGDPIVIPPPPKDSQ
jgi:hypothetical protein